MQNILTGACLLNSNNKSMEELKSIIFQITQSQANKIQFIKNEIKSGCYLINHDLVADKILEHAIIKIAELA